MSIMAESDQSPTATLGRVTSWIGYLWFLFAVLWGMGAIQALGVTGSVASFVGRTVLPAIVLIGVGRVLRKRARVDEDVIVPDTSSEPLRTPPVLPRPDPTPLVVRPVPKPPPRPAAPPKKLVDEPVGVVTETESGDETSPVRELESPSGRHKTSQEMIEEARQRWGTRP